ncbi:hypothetical protein ACFXTH_011604 [Malus domestica]
MTNDPSTLTQIQPYEGTDSIIVGNSNQLCISHVGKSSVTGLHGSLILDDVLYVPAIKKNLLSLRQFCYDNHCFFEMDDRSFRVNDKTTGQTIKATASPSMPSQQQFVMDLTTMPSLAPHNQAQQPPQAMTFSSHHEATDLDASSTALGLAPTSPLPDHSDGVSPNPRTHMSTDKPSPSTTLTPTNDADVLDQAHSDHQKFKSVNNIIYGSTPHPLPRINCCP